MRRAAFDTPAGPTSTSSSRCAAKRARPARRGIDAVEELPPDALEHLLAAARVDQTDAVVVRPEAARDVDGEDTPQPPVAVVRHSPPAPVPELRLRDCRERPRRIGKEEVAVGERNVLAQKVLRPGHPLRRRL